jgi:hypothetical protein
MILNKYIEPNKLVSDILELYPNGYNSNCFYGNRCKSYTIPISFDALAELFWYIQTVSKPKDFKIKATDCNGDVTDLQPIYHIIGKDGNGDWYILFNGLAELPPYDIFQLWVEVTYENDSVQTFFTEQYEVDKCPLFDMVYACYSKDDNGGFDGNGAWIGEAIEPFAISGSGHVGLRYFDNYTLRDLAVHYTGTQITYTAFKSRNVKSERVKTYSIYSEVVPYWYEEAISSAFAKGTVTISGKQYKISEYSSSTVGNICCERVTLNILATEESSLAMSCSTDNCSNVSLPDCTIGAISVTYSNVEYDCSIGNILVV